MYAIRSYYDFRLSVAGAQEKTAFLRMQDGWYRPSGATPTSHIFKLPMGRLGQTGLDLSGSVENEWLCQKLLAAFGMAAADTRMANFGRITSYNVCYTKLLRWADTQ